MPMHHRKVYAILAFLQLYPSASVALNFSACLADVTNCAQNSSDCALTISSTTAFSVLLTSEGQHVTSVDAATALSYTSCTTYCGTGEEQFSWYYFAQGYAAWLLPYLALVSQLPFGARRRMDNLMSAMLTLGSPTLAGYSLFMTLLNARWVNDLLLVGIDYPRAAVRQSVVQVLSSLQQVPLRVHPGESGHFESLIVHPDNDKWWSTFAEELDYPHKWSIASATSITWVIIAYLLTVGNTISIDVALNVVSPSQAAGSGLLGLLPIVVGWLVLSPKCDFDRVHNAYRKANRQVCVALGSDDHSAASGHVTSNLGLTIHPNPDWSYNRSITSPDELRTPPVFAYARVFSWYRNVYLTSLYYRAAWRKAINGVGVDGNVILGNVYEDVPRVNRLGTRKQTMSYCQPDVHELSAASVRWPPGLVFNMVAASLMSLLLQWGTTLAAFIALFFTAPVGIGCRSLVYLICGATSTVVWMLLMSSSVLGYYAQGPLDDPLAPPPRVDPWVSAELAIPLFEIQVPPVHPERESNTISVACTDTTSVRHSDPRRVPPRMLSRIADWLRWTGKCLAVLNAVGVIANAFFQYAGVYSNCYCSSNVFTQGVLAYVVINPDASDVALARRAWIGSVGLSSACCAVFMGSIYLVQDALPS